MLGSVLRKLLSPIGYEVVQITPKLDIEQEFKELHRRCGSYTVTSIARMYALYEAIRYVARHDIPGDVVECGLWKGGSSMLAALTLQACGDVKRKIYLYDTFSGMSKPTEEDVNFSGQSALPKWTKTDRGRFNEWGFGSRQEVERNMESTGYPRGKLMFVQGMVEDTLPKVMPEKISLLRLDTDWYASTYHELTHLFPRLAVGGVLIVDDYGHWKGAKAAVDRYLQEQSIPLLLNRIDYTGRIGVKLPSQ